MTGFKRRFFFNILIILIICFLVYGLAIEPNWIRIRRVTIKDPVWAKVFSGLKVVQLSDIHIMGESYRVKRVLAMVREVEPDILFLTGDYVAWGGDYEAALDFLSELKARIGIWGVLGDYDDHQSRKKCLLCHMPGTGRKTTRHNVRFLRNSGDTITLNSVQVSIFGYDPDETQKHLENALLLGERTIILTHSPLVFNHIDLDSGVLCLAGDTHGGQVRLPSWFWKLLGYQKCALFREGLFGRGENWLYVNRGIGTSHLPFRFLMPPEITLFQFME